MIRVLIVDDHDLVRSGIKRLLQNLEDITVVGEIGNGEDVLQLARKIKPDVILMDINMPGIGGLEATRRLLHGSKQVRPKVIVVSSHGDRFLPKRLIDLGAHGYINKQSDPTVLVEAIRTVYAGQRYIDPIMIDNILLSSPKVNGSPDPVTQLTDREMQILLMLARGISVEDIAEKLFLTKKTVNGYRRDAFKKLGVKTDVEATKLAIIKGLIEPDSQWH